MTLSPKEVVPLTGARVCMSLRPFENAEEFLTKFDLDTPPPYENVTHLTDRRAGFSVTRCFPSTLRFVPARTSDGRDDTVAIMHVIYAHPEEVSDSIDLRRVPIIVRINTWSLYLRVRRSGYDPSDPRSPTEESLRASRASVAPIGFDSKGEYVFDHSADAFMDSKGRVLSGRDVLDQVFQKFCNTTHLLRGLRIQFLHKARGALVSLVRSMESSIEWVLRTIFGRMIITPDGVRGLYEEHLKRLPETVKVADIEVQLNVLITSAVLCIIFLGVQEYLETSHDYLSRLLANRLFIPPATIIAIWFLDRVCPRLLLLMKKALRKVRYWLLWLEFRV